MDYLIINDRLPVTYCIGKFIHEKYDQAAHRKRKHYNHPLFLPTVLYVGSVLVNEHRLVRVGNFKHHTPCYKLAKELTAQRLWE